MPGEKPLFWVGSAKSDLLDFPEAVKDGIGTALSVAQFGGKHRQPSPGRAKGRESWKWLKIPGAIRFGRFTQYVLKGQSMYFTLSRKSHGVARRPPAQILS
jgi:phage-related protein